jgi:hypothetical protein
MSPPRPLQPGVVSAMGFRRATVGKRRGRQVHAWIDEQLYVLLLLQAGLDGTTASSAVAKILRKHLTP